MPVQQDEEGMGLLVMLEHVRSLRVADRLRLLEHPVDLLRRKSGEEGESFDEGSIDAGHPPALC
jgi:hypothetical protein